MGFGEQGNKGNFFREQRPKHKANRGTQAILGNREHRKSRFCFLGNTGTRPIFFREQGSRYPPLEGLVTENMKCAYTKHGRHLIHTKTETNNTAMNKPELYYKLNGFLLFHIYWSKVVTDHPGWHWFFRKHKIVKDVKRVTVKQLTIYLSNILKFILTLHLKLGST